jgi:hypothetical protein
MKKGRVETRCPFWSFCSALMKKRRVETDTHLGHFACIDEEEKSLKQIPNLAFCFALMKKKRV